MEQKKVRFPPLSRKSVFAAPAEHWGGVWEVLAYVEPFREVGDYAVVDICGPLAQRSGGDLLSYPTILQRAKAAFASNASAVVFKFDSPGGDFAGSLELSSDLKKMAAGSGKPLIAFCDAQCASAAYAIACAANEIVITPSAFVGSIGVWAALLDSTAADAASGHRIQIVASGARKADHNPHVPITDDAVENLRGQVNGMADLFFATVSSARNLSVEAVSQLEGVEKFGRGAVDSRLADRIVPSWNEFSSQPYLSQPAPAEDVTKASATSGGLMANKYAEAAAALAKAAEMDDDGKEFKKALAAMAKAESEDMPEKEKAAASEDCPLPMPKKKAKAEDMDEEDDMEAKKAAASTDGLLFDLAAKIQKLEAAAAAKEEASERAALFASRPDFSAEVKKTLSALSLDAVRDAVKNWPKASASNPAAANFPGGTLGAAQASGKMGEVKDTDDDFIGKKMFGSMSYDGVRSEGKEMELGSMTPEQIKKAAAALAAKGNY